MRPRGSPRGIELRPVHVRLNLLASMRPRGSPRGIRGSDDAARRLLGRFNEAAGKSPRNPGLERPVVLHSRSPGFNEAAGKSPRNLVDEIPRWSEVEACICFNEAAGKSPRNPQVSPWRQAFCAACRFNEAAGKSPRNRQVRTGLTIWHPRSGFNEAAGKSPRNLASGSHRKVRRSRQASMRPRGSPRGIGTGEAGVRRQPAVMGASMRPRGSPRGIAIAHHGLCLAPAQGRFNEAAGKSPRNHSPRAPRRWTSARFNEAAGKSPRNRRRAERP